MQIGEHLYTLEQYGELQVKSASDRVKAKAKKVAASQGGSSPDGSSKSPKLGPPPPRYTGHESAKKGK